MSSSLRDQMLKIGLISKQQANEAERQQQRHERQSQPKKKSSVQPARAPAARPGPGAMEQIAKAARDQQLNRLKQEKSEKKAHLAQIRQFIDQNRLSTVEAGESYHFVDGAKVKSVPVNSVLRDRLGRGDLVIVRHEGRYDIVPAAIAKRLQERDRDIFVVSAAASPSAAGDESDARHRVPDDLIW